MFIQIIVDERKLICYNIDIGGDAVDLTGIRDILQIVVALLNILVAILVIRERQSKKRSRRSRRRKR